jgi:hypothetical protein
MTKKILVAIYISSGILASAFITVNVFAQGTSNSYRIDESFIGPGGTLESNSSSYKLDPGQSSLGNSGGVGESGSTSFTAQSGSTTTSDPRLSCTINSGSLSFGGLSTNVTSTAAASFSVLNYTSYGYNVTLIGNPLNNGAHTLSAMSSNGTSQTGTEQFGINLKSNTVPVVGSDPVQVPSPGSFSFGAPTANYDTANSFRFVPGEAIASASKSSGQTDYTISYIINASIDTPSGNYAGNQTILCTGTY